MTTGYATRASIAGRAKRVVLPPARPLSHAAFCRTMVIPDGPLRGMRYDPDADPVHAVLCQQIDLGIWQRIVGVGAVQTGKSLALILVPTLRNLTLLRQPVVYSQPTLTKLHEGWAGKLAPSIRDSGYGAWLPTDGQGAKGSQTPKFITLREPKTRARAGTMYLIPGGGASESAQSAVTAAVVAVDEIDSFQDRHRVELVTKRADSYGPRGLRIYTSTVKRDGDSGDEASIILALYNESTASRLWFSCPHCQHWQTMEWERVVYDQENEPAAIASARIACAGCGVAWTEDDRQRALRSWRLVHRGQQVDQQTGAVVGVPPQTVAFGLLWTALDSSLRSLGQVAAEHWRADRAVALGDHGPMRSFYRDQLCRPYTGDQITDDDGITTIPTRNRLAALSAGSTYVLSVDRREDEGDSVHFTEIPAWCEHTTIGVDVQRGGDRAPGRLYYYALSRGGGRGATTGWGSVVAAPKGRQPTEVELHEALGRLDGLLRDWAPSATIVRRGVDVGDQQDEIVRWLRSHRDWMPVKGTGPIKATDRRDRAGWLYVRDQEGGWTLRLMETQAVSRVLHGELLAKDRDKPGSLLLPKGLERNSALIQHLCATVEYAPGKWSEKPQHRVHHPEWQSRHDYLDAAAIARALAYDWEQRLASPLPKRKTGFIGSLGV